MKLIELLLNTHSKAWLTPLLLIVIAFFSMTLAPVSNVEAKKPVHPKAGTMLLSGDVIADSESGGAVGTFNVDLRSGKETTATIVVRGFYFDPGFAKEVDFYPGKYGDDPPDGATCFSDPDEGPVMVSGAYGLYEDGTAEFSTWPEFLTADGEAIQKYHFLLTGEWYYDFVDSPDSLEDFPITGEVKVVLTFDRVEITTEGKGQNRRRSCTGVFPSEKYPYIPAATAIFSRE